MSKHTKNALISCWPYLLLISTAVIVYYKFFIFQKIPFPGDLLIGSYSPWFDTYKIPVQNPLISDVFSQFFLWKYIAIDSFKIGQWPLWNPYSFSGTPLLATFHSAALYPLNVLLFLPRYTGWGIFIFAQTLIALLSFYLFSSLLAESKIARIIGSVIFGFGGLMTTWLEIGTGVHAAAWLPLVLFWVTKYKQTSKLRFIFLITLTLDMIILAGNPQITTYTIVVLSIYSLVIFWENKSYLPLKLLYIFASVFIALFIAAPQLLPTAELFQKSIRLNDTYTSGFNFGLLPAKDGLKFFIADFFGHPSTRNYWGNLNYLESSGFVATATLPLLLFSIFYLKRNRIHLFFILLFFSSLILLFNNPISQIIYQSKIPLLTASYASRMLFITVFSIALLSSFSVNQIIKDHQEDKLFKLTLYSLMAFIGIIIGTAIVYKIVENIIANAQSQRYLEFYLKDNDYSLANFIITLRNCVIPFSLLTIFIILLFFKKIKLLKMNSHLFFSLIFLLIIFDLGRYFLKFNTFVEGRFVFPSTEAIDYLKNRPGVFRVGREHAEVLPANTWAAYNLQSFEGYDPIYLSQYSKLVNFINKNDIRNPGAGRYVDLYATYESPYLDTLNVKYFIGITRDDKGRTPGDLVNYKFKETDYQVIFKKGSTVILENPNSLERAYLAPSIENLSKKQLEEKFMQDETFDPRKKIIITSDLKIDSVTGVGSVQIAKYTNNSVSINTKTDKDQVLVLADQYDEGWRARIDDSEVKISPANLISRAIKLPAGSHKVLFYYWPQSFDFGLRITVITVFSGLIISIIYIRKKEF